MVWRTAGTGFYATLPPVTDAELSEAEIAAMTDGWLDEQHAYAVYGAVIDQFGAVAPFVNIQRSEAQHIAAWELIFDRYGVPVPAVPEFDLPTFATLSDACQTAAAAEIANFGLYELDADDPERLSRHGSGDHRAAQCLGIQSPARFRELRIVTPKSL